MRIGMLISSVVAIGFASSAVKADDFVEWCIASAPDGVDAAELEATCSCMAEATEGNEEVQADMKAAGEIADRAERFASLSPESQEVVSSCR